MTTDAVHIPVSIGELVDKLVILEIKQRRIKDVAKLSNIVRELDVLTASVEALALPTSPAFQPLKSELVEVNEAIWDAENVVRRLDREGAFGIEFVQTARSTYRNNDRRARIKRTLNELFESRFVEEKEHN